MTAHHISLRHTAFAVLPAFALFAFQPQAALAAAEPIGVAAAVNPDAAGTPPQMERRIIEVGTNMLSNEHVVTGPNGQAQLIFNDGSAFSIGPNSELTLDSFVYDPAKGTGQMALTVTKGVFRFVGGKISKDNPVQIKVGTATMGIRGGIATLTAQPGQPVVGRFLFGREMSMNRDGVTQITTRPGTAIDLPPGLPPQPPRVVTSSEMRQANSQLEAKPGGGGESGGGGGGGGGQQAGGGGAAPAPAAIEGKLDSSGVSQQNSATPPAAITPVAPTAPVQQQAASNPASQSQSAAQAASSSVSQNQNQNQNQQAANNTTLVTPLNGRLGRFIFSNGSTAEPFSSLDTNTGNAVANSYYNQKPESFYQVTNPGGSKTLRVDLNATPLTTATAISLPSSGNTGSFSVSNVATAYGNFYGTGYGTAANNFFYYALTNTSNSDVKLVLFGGSPTTPANFRTTGFGTYTLGNGVNNVPLIGPQVNGNSSLLGVISTSPLYSVYGSSLAPNSLAGGTPGLSLQASISIAGQGNSQSSLLSGMTGIFASDPANNDVVLAGGVRGSYRAGGASTTVRYSSSVSSAAAGSNGSAIYGDSGEYMALTPDEITIDSGSNSVSRTTQVGVSVQTAATPVVDDYYFINSAVRSSSNATIVTDPARSTRTLQGYAAGMMERFSQNDQRLTTSSNNPMGVTLSTDASNNRAQASMALQGDTQAFQLEFGGTSGTGAGRSAFVNDQLYAARESATSNSTVDSVAVDRARLMLVSSSVASVSGSFLTYGANFCTTCTDLSWGWWIGDLRETSSGPTDRVHLGTYVTGLLPTLPAVTGLTGTASFQGHALGSVNNNNSRYLAIGTYLQTWNFDTNTGTGRIIGFDGYNFLGNLSSGNEREFSGTLNQTGGAMTGNLAGSFFSSGSTVANNVGGQFTLDGADYSAVGTVAAGSATITPLSGFQGRFLRFNQGSQATFSGFDSSTLYATAEAANNNTSVSFERIGSSWIRGTTTHDDFYFYAPPSNSAGSATSASVLSPYGTQTGSIYFASDLSFFFASMRDYANQSTTSTVLFGGTPTTVAQFPTTGMAAYTMGQANLPVPFASSNISFSDAMATQRYVSPLYALYSPNTTYDSTTSSTQRAVHVQASIGIAGQGADQQSFLVAETGNFIQEGSFSADAGNRMAAAGAMRGSIRKDDTEENIRLVSHVASAGTGDGSAIYGDNADHIVLGPDAILSNTGSSMVERQTALAFSQPHDALSGTSYNFFAVANKQASNPTLLTEPDRTSRTLNGYVGGLMEVNPLGNTVVSGTDRVLVNQNDLATDVAIQTNASSNRLAATFQLDNQQGGAGAHAYQMSFGSVTGTSGGSSAFINDKIFAARETPADNASQIDTGNGNVDLLNTYNGGAGSNGGTSIAQRGIMVSHDLAQVSSSALPSGVTLCNCEYLSWGWWVTDIRHTGGGTNNERDRVHLATWVAGTLPNVAEIPTTGTASYSGHVAGNVNNNGSRYVAFGSYNQSWNFATKAGTGTITSFDNIANISGALTSSNGRDFSGAISGTGVSGNLVGSFFKGGTDPVKAAAGNFTLTGTNYQAAGTFAAQKP